MIGSSDPTMDGTRRARPSVQNWFGCLSDTGVAFHVLGKNSNEFVVLLQCSEDLECPGSEKSSDNVPLMIHPIGTVVLQDSQSNPARISLANFG